MRCALAPALALVLVSQATSPAWSSTASQAMSHAATVEKWGHAAAAGWLYREAAELGDPAGFERAAEAFTKAGERELAVAAWEDLLAAGGDSGKRGAAEQELDRLNRGKPLPGESSRRSSAGPTVYKHAKQVLAWNHKRAAAVLFEEAGEGGNLEALRRSGNLYSASQMPRDAIRVWRRFLERAPNSPKAHGVQAAIDRAKSRIDAPAPEPAEAPPAAAEPEVREPESQLQIPWSHVPAGAFILGSTDGEEDERPRREVTLSSFEIGTPPAMSAASPSSASTRRARATSALWCSRQTRPRAAASPRRRASISSLLRGLRRQARRLATGPPNPNSFYSVSGIGSPYSHSPCGAQWPLEPHASSVAQVPSFGAGG